MPQSCNGTRWNIVAAVILIAAIFGALKFTPLLGGARLAYAQFPTQTEHHPFPTNPSNPGPPVISPTPPSPMSLKQKERLVKANFHKTQQDADQLFKLAQSLKEDMDKSNANILSIGIVDKAKKIEKLAKKIKSEAVNND
ncbi:MAG: hypothetical protein ACRD3T_00615 [Terriglobia bacterium]